MQLRIHRDCSVLLGSISEDVRLVGFDPILSLDTRPSLTSVVEMSISPVERRKQTSGRVMLPAGSSAGTSRMASGSP